MSTMSARQFFSISRTNQLRRSSSCLIFLPRHKLICKAPTHLPVWPMNSLRKESYSRRSNLVPGCATDYATKVLMANWAA